MNNHKGFTLTELLTVVIIVGVLASIALPQYSKSVERARATEAMQVVKSINDAIYSYAAGRSGDNACPTTFSKLMITLPVANDNVSEIQLDYFTYAIGSNKGATNAVVAGTNCPGVIAKRGGSKDSGGAKYDYQIWNPYRVRTATQRGALLACYSPGNKPKSIEVCQSLDLYTAGAKPR